MFISKTAASLVIAILCNVTLAETENQYVKNIVKGPGIFFDPVGTLKIINDQFHIVIPVEIIPIKNHIMDINKVFNNVQSYCQRSELIGVSQCHNLLQPLEAILKDLQRDFNAVSHLVSDNYVSKRSAWFSGIGTVFKHIFGTLTEDDAKTYEDAIKTLYENDKKISGTLKKTVIASQSAITNINQSLHEMNLNQAKLNGVVKELASTVSNITNAFNEVNFRNNFYNILNILQSNLLTLSFKVEDLLNSILLIKSNTLHPSVLTPNQMYNDIVNNFKLLPKYRDFPVNIEISNIHILINIADLTCYYFNKKLMFIVKIPLVTLEHFNIYKTVPLPIPHTEGNLNSFAMILPSEQFLALSTDKLSYIYLKDLNDCKSILTYTYLCEITDVYAVLNNPSCEIEIITKALTTLPENCPVKVMFGDLDIWHKLNNNKWIFVQSKSTKLSIECNQNVSELVISGTGVLNLPIDCVGFHKNLKLVTKVYPKTYVPAVSSNFDIIDDDCCKSVNKLSNNFSIPKIKIINLDNLKSIKAISDLSMKDLNEIKNPNNFNNHVSFPILSIFSVILVFSFVFVYFYKKGKCSRKLQVSNNIPVEQDNNLENQSNPSVARLRVC
ncbi:uncharacterized protein LOC123715955 [Pieris brassicae]|uniref:uncharacterized protein LOC123715955 n=1 Tax=Pieris brassicae TaxID=7116 RepID=UPI001E65EA33|nr:uncharacterized protein LOC123715955 [Pieris brassicae]